MRVHCLAPLAVGTLEWRAPEPVTSLIVKVTYEIGEDGACSLSERPKPLSTGDPAPSDYVPRKPRVDLLVFGYAVAPEPTTSIPVEVSMAGYTRSVVACSGIPIQAIPLEPLYVRDPVTGLATTLGMTGDFDPRTALPMHRSRFDFGVFQAAPPEQQLFGVFHGGELQLRGLLGTAARARVRLPSRRPQLFIIDPALGPLEVELSCDTVVVDTRDVSLCLVYRAVIEAAKPPGDIAVALGPRPLAPWEVEREVAERAQQALEQATAALARGDARTRPMSRRRNRGPRG